MNEVFRFTAYGTNGVSVFLPPKYGFVFYETKMELIRKGKIKDTIKK